MKFDYTNNHIISSSKKKCKKFLKKKSKTRNDIIDFLINLHLALEASLNQLFRDVLYYNGNFEDVYAIYEDFDRISFIDKTIALICFSTFTDSLSRKETEKKAKSLANRLKDFAGIRNKLLHGHHIIVTDTALLGRNVQNNSKDKLKITMETAEKQKEHYIEIIRILTFFISNLTGICTSPTLIYKYLNTDFLTG